MDSDSSLAEDYPMRGAYDAYDDSSIDSSGSEGGGAFENEVEMAVTEILSNATDIEEMVAKNLTEQQKLLAEQPDTEFVTHVPPPSPRHFPQKTSSCRAILSVRRK